MTITLTLVWGCFSEGTTASLCKKRLTNLAHMAEASVTSGLLRALELFLVPCLSCSDPPDSF